MRTFLTIALALTLVAGAARGANDCTVDTLAEIQTDDGTTYVYNEPCQFDCLFSIWIIEEDNGQPGLQKRGDQFEPDACE